MTVKTWKQTRCLSQMNGKQNVVHLCSQKETQLNNRKKNTSGTSLGVQSVRLCATNSGGAVSIPVQGTKTPHGIGMVRKIFFRKGKHFCFMQQHGSILSAFF